MLKWLQNDKKKSPGLSDFHFIQQREMFAFKTLIKRWIEINNHLIMRRKITAFHKA